MKNLQLQDPDIGPILRLRTQQANQPRPEEVLPESEVTKVLWGQWHALVVKDGVLYREWSGKNGRPPILQLVVPPVKKLEFVKHCNERMTGGHRAFKSTLDQVQRRAFWFHWRRDVQRCCRQCQNCLCYHRGRLPRWGPLANYLIQRSKSHPIIAHVDKLKAWDTDHPPKSWLVPATSQQPSTGEVANQNVAENEEQSRNEPEPGPSGRNANLPQTKSQQFGTRILLNDDKSRRTVPERSIRLPGTDRHLHSVLTTSARRSLGTHSQLSNVWIDPVAPYVVLRVTKTE